MSCINGGGILTNTTWKHGQTSNPPQIAFCQLQSNALLKQKCDLESLHAWKNVLPKNILHKEYFLFEKCAIHKTLRCWHTMGFKLPFYFTKRSSARKKNPHNCFQTVLFMDTKLWQKQAFFYSFLRSKKFLRILKKVNLNQLPSNFERICELMNQHLSNNVHKAHRLKKLRWNNAIDIFSIWYKEERIGIWVFIWVFYHNGKQKGNWKQ